MELPHFSNPPLVLIDACVLFSFRTRDLLFELARRGLFHPRWTNDLHNEWTSALAKVHPEIDRKELKRCRRLMDILFPEALISGYEQLIPELPLRDENDRHVLAAAIHGKAQVILTANTKDFPLRVLERYGVTRLTPDQLLLALWAEHEVQLREAAQVVRGKLDNPPVPEEVYLGALKRSGLTRFVRHVQTG